MIVDVPNGDDFKSSGIDYLNLAWSTLINLLKQLKEWQDFYEEYYRGENEEVGNPSRSEEYWKKAQRRLSTALSLIQQGTEFLLKGHIATVSPYLLISGDPSTYPRKSQKQDTHFSEFKTIDAQDLIRAYNTVSDSHLPPDFQQQFEKLRSKRNTIMHTVDLDLHIDTRDLFVEILEICHHLLAPGLWIEIRKNFIQNEPQSVWIGEDPPYDEVSYQTNLEIGLVTDLLQPSECQKYFRFDKRQRRYICPVCYSNAFRETYADIGLEHDIPRLAQLEPNEPTSTYVHCIICKKSSSVDREDCLVKDCPGNVIDQKFYGICLTCGSDGSD